MVAPPPPFAALSWSSVRQIAHRLAAPAFQRFSGQRKVAACFLDQELSCFFERMRWSILVEMHVELQLWLST